MKKRMFVLCAVLLFTAQSYSEIRIVTTIPDLKSIAEFIGGDNVDVFSIATGYQNPHFVDPKPSYILKLSRADMFITVGLDLEIGWVPPLLNSARNAKIQKGGDGYVDASVGISLLQVPTSKVSRQEGDIHIYGSTLRNAFAPPCLPWREWCRRWGNLARRRFPRCTCGRRRRDSNPCGHRWSECRCRRRSPPGGLFGLRRFRPFGRQCLG